MHDEFDEGSWTAGFRSKRTWIRGFFMLVFLFILWFARLLLIVIAVFQFGAQLIMRRPVARGLPLGRSLAAYLQQIALFLTFNSEHKPFPFAPWPDPGAAAAAYDEEDDGEEGEAYEAYEPYPPPADPFAPEPEETEPAAAAPEPEPEPESEPEAEPEPEEEPEPKPRPARTAAKGGKKKKPAKTEAADNSEEAADLSGPDEDEDEPTPPRPDA